MSGFIVKKRYAYMPQPQCNVMLTEACEKGNISLAKKAIKEGAYNIQAGLIIAIEKDHVKLAKYLLGQYVDRGLADIKTIMYHACLHGHDSIVSDILEYISTKIRIMSIGNTNTEVYINGLYGACEGNNVELIERMITLGADDIKQGFYKACYNGGFDAVKYLVEYILDSRLVNYILLQGISDACIHYRFNEVKQDRFNICRYLLDLIYGDETLKKLDSLIYDITVDNKIKKLMISHNGFHPTVIESFTELNIYMMYLANDLKYKHSSWFLSRILSDDLFKAVLK